MESSRYTYFKMYKDTQTCNTTEKLGVCVWGGGISQKMEWEGQYCEFTAIHGIAFSFMNYTRVEPSFKDRSTVIKLM